MKETQERCLTSMEDDIDGDLLQRWQQDDEMFVQDDSYDLNDGFCVDDEESIAFSCEESIPDLSEQFARSVSVQGSAQKHLRKCRFAGEYGDDQWCSEDEEDSAFIADIDASSDEDSQLDISCCSDLFSDSEESCSVEKSSTETDEATVTPMSA